MALDITDTQEDFAHARFTKYLILQYLTIFPSKNRHHRLPIESMDDMRNKKERAKRNPRRSDHEGNVPKRNKFVSSKKNEVEKRMITMESKYGSQRRSKKNFSCRETARREASKTRHGNRTGQDGPKVSELRCWNEPTSLHEEVT